MPELFSDVTEILKANNPRINYSSKTIYYQKEKIQQQKSAGYN